MLLPKRLAKGGVFPESEKILFVRSLGLLSNKFVNGSLDLDIPPNTDLGGSLGFFWLFSYFFVKFVNTDSIGLFSLGCFGVTGAKGSPNIDGPVGARCPKIPPGLGATLPTGPKLPGVDPGVLDPICGENTFAPEKTLGAPTLFCC